MIARKKANILMNWGIIEKSHLDCLFNNMTELTASEIGRL